MTKNEAITITITVDGVVLNQRSASWTCDSCGGNDNPDSCNHCLSCGSTRKTPSYLHKCSVCGWVEPEGMGNPPAFCGKCGARIIEHYSSLTFYEDALKSLVKLHTAKMPLNKSS